MIQLGPATHSQESMPTTFGVSRDDNFGMTSVPGTPLTMPDTFPSLEGTPCPPFPTLVPPSPPILLDPCQFERCKIEPEYYWPSVTFVTEGHLVRLPVELFTQHSDVFAEEYGLPRPTSDHSSLDTGDPRIELDGIAWDDFKNFLKAVVPRSPFLEAKPTLTESEWISVLKLSTRWLFNDLRKIAIDELSKVRMDPVQRVCLAKAYDVYDWLVSGYEELVERHDPITEEEGQEVGMGVALRLCGIALRRLRGSGVVPATSGHRVDVVNGFVEELESIRGVQGRYLTKQERLEKEEAERAARQEEEAKRAEEEELKREVEERMAREAALEAERRKEVEEAQRKAEEEEAAKREAERVERIREERLRLQRLEEEERRVREELSTLERLDKGKRRSVDLGDWSGFGGTGTLATAGHPTVVVRSVGDENLDHNPISVVDGVGPTASNVFIQDEIPVDILACHPSTDVQPAADDRENKDELAPAFEVKKGKKTYLGSSEDGEMTDGKKKKKKRRSQRRGYTIGVLCVI
ncbi:hypothetical protein CC1G_09490 [Coprinopsis cinerea okayama7|uniref:BTB domain-containing protein n=1 Tax=Coprinopsis cinerea (strain Okayama-7 / 130 / ATCC MYA-4618 / FGSC 9003) TaxID=240176 RepID=A8PDI1_COPC7|nr:hypothetical protein CC1G_09490 [Coprinopsis cinerea okayama7\|eukprot:XP_001840606.2 hypothetical protein CC1G_09490 [Coprinopsis cinerea okayama7\